MFFGTEELCLRYVKKGKIHTFMFFQMKPNFAQKFNLYC